MRPKVIRVDRICVEKSQHCADVVVDRDFLAMCFVSSCFAVFTRRTPAFGAQSTPFVFKLYHVRRQMVQWMTLRSWTFL